MKKNLISLASVLSAILVFTLTAGAQITNNYDLSKYKLPDTRYRQLETVFVLSGENNTQNIYDQETLARRFNGSAGANYNSYLNTRKTQRTQYLGIDLRGYSSYDKNSLRYEDRSNFSPSIAYQINNKRYFANQLFIATGLSARYRYGYNNDSYEYYDTTRLTGNNTTNEHTVTLSLPLEFGIGRIEQVQDYYQAIYTYEDLLKSGRAVAGKSEEEIMELAKLITQLKNRRYFDFRIRNIEDIETLDSFLITNNFKTLSDARFYATLIDNRSFVTHFVRESGTSIALAVKPDFTYYVEDKMYKITDMRREDIRESYGAEGGIVFEHHKPLNLYWQTNTSVRALAGYTQQVFRITDTSILLDDTTNTPRVNLYLNHSLQYFPNTRTRMSASIDASYFHYFDEKLKSGDIVKDENTYYYAGLTLDADYYISQQLRLNASASITYFHSDVNDAPWQDQEGLNTRFGVRLVYSIF